MSTLMWLVAAVAVALLSAPAADAAATEIQRPDEHAYLMLHKHGWTLYVELYPLEGVAVIQAQKGEPEARRGRAAGAIYAMRASLPTAGEPVDLQLGTLAHVQGRFVGQRGQDASRGNDKGCTGPQPISEFGRFVGEIRFRGEHGYLTVHARAAEALVERSFRLRCQHGHAQHFGNLNRPLVDYVDELPTRAFTSRDGTRLSALLKRGHRYLEFVATQELYEESSTFQAAAYERLPGSMVASRWVEASSRSVGDFTVEGSEERPRTATVTPPAPFAGRGVFLRRAQTMRGDLSAAFPGLGELRLVGPGSKAGICALTPKMIERVCG